MKIIKQIIKYLLWIGLSLLSGVAYMRVVLGPKPPPSKGFLVILDSIYNIALVEVGLRFGGIIALLFVVLDIFYLNKKLKYNLSGILIRLLAFFILIVLVGVIHYLLEKVIDVI